MMVMLMSQRSFDGLSGVLLGRGFKGSIEIEGFERMHSDNYCRISK